MLTFSSLFCQLSSLFTIRSMQCDSVARIPAVVALKVMASPLKSMPLIPFRLRDWNTEDHTDTHTRTRQTAFSSSSPLGRSDLLTFLSAAVVVVQKLSVCASAGEVVFIVLHD